MLQKTLAKHRNNIFRLLVNVDPSSRVETMGEIKADLNEFVEMIHLDKSDLKNLEINRTKFSDLMEIFKNCFL